MAAKPRTPPTPEQAASIEVLSAKLAKANKRIAELSRRLRTLQHAQQHKGVVMSKRLVRRIRACLHPDRKSGNDHMRKRLQELSQEFNSLKIVPPSDE
jgi:hypothetical protein